MKKQADKERKSGISRTWSERQVSLYNWTKSQLEIEADTEMKEMEVVFGYVKVSDKFVNESWDERRVQATIAKVLHEIVDSAELFLGFEDPKAHEISKFWNDRYDFDEKFTYRLAGELGLPKSALSSDLDAALHFWVDLFSTNDAWNSLQDYLCFAYCWKRKASASRQGQASVVPMRMALKQILT